jgi:hypothetical protein
MDPAIRLMRLSELEELYVPSPMACEIYTKIYLAMTRSLNKKNSKDAIRQRNCNYRAMLLSGRLNDASSVRLSGAV